MGLWDNGPAIEVLHCTEPGHDKLYLGRVDAMDVRGRGTRFLAICSYGAATSPNLSDHVKGEFATFDEAARKVDSFIRQKLHGGYLVVGSPDYVGGMTRQRCIEKIRTTMTVGFGGNVKSPVAAGAARLASSPVLVGAMPSSRASRSVRI